MLVQYFHDEEGRPLCPVHEAVIDVLAGDVWSCPLCRAERDWLRRINGARIDAVLAQQGQDGQLLPWSQEIVPYEMPMTTQDMLHAALRSDADQ